MKYNLDIDEDELFPFYKPRNPLRGQFCIDVPKDTYDKWQRVLGEFFEIQDEMKEYADQLRKLVAQHYNECANAQPIEITTTEDMRRRYRCIGCGIEWFGEWIWIW